MKTTLPIASHSLLREEMIDHSNRLSLMIVNTPTIEYIVMEHYRRQVAKNSLNQLEARWVESDRKEYFKKSDRSGAIHAYNARLQHNPMTPTGWGVSVEKIQEIYDRLHVEEQDYD